jgi:hypothetical protein
MGICEVCEKREATTRIDVCDSCRNEIIMDLSGLEDVNKKRKD